MRAALLLLAAAALAGAAAPDAGHGGPVTPDDIMALHDMREAEIAPDGRTVLFTVLDRMATFSPEHTAIWSVPADGSARARPLVDGKGVAEHPRWSPDGRRIAFLSNRPGAAAGRQFRREAAPPPPDPVSATPPTPPAGAPAGAESSRQIWLREAAGGAPVPLTALASDVSDFVWSPDGRRIAFLAADPETPAERAAKAAGRDPIEIDRERHPTRLWLLDLADRSARPLTGDAVNVSGMDWSPDGRQLALRVADSPRINDFFYHSRIVLFDPASGMIGRTLLDHAASAPRWSPDGRALLATEILSPGFIGVAPRIVDIASGRVTRLADAYHGTVTEPRWAADGRAAIALSFEGTRSKLIRIDRASGAIRTIAAVSGEAAGYTVAHGGRIAVAVSGPDRPADVWVVDGGAPRVVTRINPQVTGWRLGAVREVSWRNRRDGRRVYGVLVTPPGYVAGTPLRTVVQVHGGPEWAWWSGWLGSWHEWAQMLATHGFAVFLPNIRGSDGQGTGFARAVGGDWGGMDFQDLDDGVDMLVADRIADPHRLGIGGWSYGGFMAAWAVTHSDRFRAAVAGATPSDLAAFARITDTPDFPAGYFGDAATNLPALDAHSPTRALGHAAAPVLVLHGEADTRVPVSLGLELHRGLRLLGKPSEMVRYPREPHWLHEPAHQRDVQARVLAWFERYL